MPREINYSSRVLPGLRACTVDIDQIAKKRTEMAQFSNALRPVREYFSFFFFSFSSFFFFFLPPGSAVFNRGINQPECGWWSWSWSTASAIDRGLSTTNKDLSLRDTKSVRFSRLLLAFTSYPRTFLVSSYVPYRHSLAIQNSFFVHNDPSLGRAIKGSRKWDQRDSREERVFSSSVSTK